MLETLHPQMRHHLTNGEGKNAWYFVPGPLGDRLSIICSDGSDWSTPIEGMLPQGLPGPAWEHVSVKATDGPRRGRGYAWRVPTWREMVFVKDLFWGPEEWVVQFHPAESEYVNDHPAVLHLWKCSLGFPTPPRECVGGIAMPSDAADSTPQAAESAPSST